MRLLAFFSSVRLESSLVSFLTCSITDFLVLRTATLVDSPSCFTILPMAFILSAVGLWTCTPSVIAKFNWSTSSRTMSESGIPSIRHQEYPMPYLGTGTSTSCPSILGLSCSGASLTAFSMFCTVCSRKAGLQSMLQLYQRVLQRPQQQCCGDKLPII